MLGAGSWGTALAMLLARNGHRVQLWDRDAAHIRALRDQGCNQRHLPGIPLPEGISPEPDFDSAARDCDHILVAVPSGGFRETLERLRQTGPVPLRLIWASKGLEPGSGRFLHQVVAEALPDAQPHAALSGPSFAVEVARGLPTAVTVASPDATYAAEAAALFHGERFRTYTSTDLVGVELGGAAKNVLAIAAGISDGMGYGANARAALITRGLSEIMRLGTRLGGQPETFMGLAGVGDLVLTCTDDLSRNRRLGLALGRGESIESASARIGQAIEGKETARELDALARELGVEMPITAQVKAVLCDGVSPANAVRALLTRDARPEPQ